VEIKPCPFCGSSDLGIGRSKEDREGYPTYVYCATCGASGPRIYTRDKAVFTCTAFACEKTGWNERTL
jgi:Lar family restriction alleviation protein